MAADIQVYGADWCGVTFAVRKYLRDARLSYDYYDVDRDPEADVFVRSVHSDVRRFPLVVVEGTVLTLPTPGTLKQILDDHGVRPVVSRAKRLDDEESTT